MTTATAAPPTPMLKFHSAWIDDDDCRAVVEALKSGWITTGPRTGEFETQVAEFVGAKFAVGVTSCTAALHLALLALDIGPGDEVITSPITFLSTVNVIHHVGAKPVFADVHEDTLNLDPAQVAKRITKRTKAVLPVHFAGHPCEMGEILSLAKKRKLRVIQDCAHSLEARFEGRTMGGMGDIACYSFYATKNITSGEGGMLTTNNEKLVQRLRVLRLHGMSRDAWKRYGEQGYKHWDALEAGWKYNMFDLQAALGLSQLKKVDAWWKRRRELVAKYDEAFRDLADVGRLSVRPNVKSAYHIYVLQSLRKKRDEALNEIQARGVGLGVHFRPVHLMTFYRKHYGFKKGLCPRAEAAGDRVLTLPLYPKMTDEEQRRVIEAVREVLG